MVANTATINYDSGFMLDVFRVPEDFLLLSDLLNSDKRVVRKRFLLNRDFLISMCTYVKLRASFSSYTYDL